VLKQKSSGSGTWVAWLESIKELSALIGGILSIIHPDLYKAGIEAFDQLAHDHSKVQEHDEYLQLLQYWTTPFSGMSIISNRETPIHQDVQTRDSWYDVLLTVGDYSNGRVELPTFGVRLQYDPGTIVALSGKVVPHGVPKCDGNRVCLAYFMRKNVHERAGVHAASWMTADRYNGILESL
jgi:Oxygenase domain of the 2OGFeDO superfamily